jgi:hypothetical protein
VSDEDKLRAVGNHVREARERIDRAMNKLRGRFGADVGLIELELAQRALYAAEQQGRP